MIETSLRPYFVRMLCNHVEIRLMREATARKPWTPDAEILSGTYCRKCRGEQDGVLHARDTMCCLDVNDARVCPTCIICGCTFGDPCPTCRGRGFHFPGCSDPSNDAAKCDKARFGDACAVCDAKEGA